MNKKSNKKIITDELKSYLNVESKPIFYDVDKNSVKNFAIAVGNENPLYFDETFARSTVYGTIIAPYMYLRSLRPVRFDPEFPEPFSHILDAGSKFNFFFPIKIGDTISVIKKLVDIFEKDGRMGKMLFRKIEITYSNQINQIVAKELNTIITYGYGEKDPGLEEHS
tara:strand:+ start:6584 stop:7084 length:501 start_codon:yes stop_codon:yes gene_type:complete